MGSYELSNGNLLIARTGGTIGKSYLVEELSVRAVFASYLIRIIPSSLLLPKYLKLFLESPLYWKQLYAKSTGTSQELIAIDVGNGILLKPKKPFQETTLEQVAGCLKYRGPNLDELEGAIL